MQRLKQLAQQLAPKARHALCRLSGGHELYRAHEDTRIYQRCACGYETRGWTIDRRDRRMHLVARAK